MHLRLAWLPTLVELTDGSRSLGRVFPAGVGARQTVARSRRSGRAGGVTRLPLRLDRAEVHSQRAVGGLTGGAPFPLRAQSRPPLVAPLLVAASPQREHSPSIATRAASSPAPLAPLTLGADADVAHDPRAGSHDTHIGARPRRKENARFVQEAAARGSRGEGPHAALANFPHATTSNSSPTGR